MVVEDGRLVDILTVTDMLGVPLCFLPRATRNHPRSRSADSLAFVRFSAGLVEVALLACGVVLGQR